MPLFYKQLEFCTYLVDLNHFMSIPLNPPHNIIKLQLAFTCNFQQLAQNHSVKLPLCKSHWHRAHFAFNIQLFNSQNRSLESDYFVTISCPIYEFVDGCKFHAFKQISLG